ncbi:101_t:CDS:1, partial [Funneliformis mosseae]
TSLSHYTIEYLRTWLFEDDFREIIHIGYNEVISFTEYLQINNQIAPLM